MSQSIFAWFSSRLVLITICAAGASVIGCDDDGASESDTTTSDTGAEPDSTADSADADVADSADAGVADTGVADTANSDTTAACVDLSGLYRGSGSCVSTQPGGPSPPFPEVFCVRQIGCDVTAEREDSTSYEGSANAVDARFVRTGFGGVTDSCVATPTTGGMASLSCLYSAPEYTCDGQLSPVDTGGAAACCDAIAQDCGAGQRCQQVVIDGIFVTACIEVTGDVPLGGACERSAQGIGFDDCQIGGYCANYGSAISSERTCHAICSATEDCAANEGCTQIGSLPRTGACAATCSPFVAAGEPMGCPAGTQCHVSRGWVSEGFATTSLCFPPGQNLAEGEACNDAAACAEGLFCSFGVCVLACDGDNPCSAGLTCQEIAGVVPSFPAGLGVCN